jgi:hypothetical protein
MFQYYAIAALDIATERRGEEERAIARYRLLREAAEVRNDGRPPRPDRIRALIARPVRAFSDATHAVSEAACVAASRIEGRTA